MSRVHHSDVHLVGASWREIWSGFGNGHGKRRPIIGREPLRTPSSSIRPRSIGVTEINTNLDIIISHSGFMGSSLRILTFFAACLTRFLVLAPCILPDLFFFPRFVLRNQITP